METPYASRPLRNFVIAIGRIIETDDYLEMTEAEFVSSVMKMTHGSARPTDAAEWFSKLRSDAGLPMA